ncbi:hypothetical protein PUW24_22315 [Paenibacillus urinalis]|nr:hypothetical protein [Paenibacillus urinalis]WDH96851.1 hypothetical protein PUW24_22315 [Paenibacillus urinalis]
MKEADTPAVSYQVGTRKKKRDVSTLSFFEEIQAALFNDFTRISILCCI